MAVGQHLVDGDLPELPPGRGDPRSGLFEKPIIGAVGMSIWVEIEWRRL
jgi:hypothetical protein